MYLSLLFFGELIALYLLSRRLNQAIFSMVYRGTHSEHISILITTLIMFPGTVVHELSHLFTAEILGVKTGKLTLVPERISDNHIQAGSVMVAKTDPFRRTLIGLAPVFIGIICITLLSIQITRSYPFVQCFLSQIGCSNISVPPSPRLSVALFFLFGYLLFTISNNMFSSEEDLQGVTPVLILLAILIGTTYAIGFRVQLTGAMIQILESLLRTLTTNLGIVLGINLVLLLIFQILLYLISPRR